MQHILMTPALKARLEKGRFHNLQSVATNLKEILDIDILDGLKAEDVEFAKLMFHRRHVYEHKGGEADEKYIADSGNTSVCPKQGLRETRESAHRIVGLVLRMAADLHRGFHEILPAEEVCWFSTEYTNQIVEAQTGQRLGLKQMHWHSNWVVRETELDAPTARRTLSSARSSQPRRHQAQLPRRAEEIDVWESKGMRAGVLLSRFSIHQRSVARDRITRETFSQLAL